jgi:hypothetical protein
VWPMVSTTRFKISNCDGESSTISILAMNSP